MDNNNNGVYFMPENASNGKGASQTYFQPAPVIKKVYEPMSKRDRRFIGIVFAAILVLVDFALFHGFHAGFTIGYFVLFGVVTAYLNNKANKFNPFASFCGILSLIGSLYYTIDSDELTCTIMTVLIGGLFSIYCMGLSGVIGQQGNYNLIIDAVKSALFAPFENMPTVIGSFRTRTDGKKSSFATLIGLVVSLPVLMIIVPLLIKGDAAFEGLIKTVAKNIGIYAAELLISALILPFAFSYLYGESHKLYKPVEKHIFGRLLPISGCISFMCVITATYLVYLFSQLAYFFSAFSGLLPKGYTRTASAFARRGFYEMFAICAINIVIVTAVSIFAKRRKNGKSSLAIKLMSCFISLFSVLMIATAMQKMKLNISIYGLTANRIMVSVFMVMMLIIIAFFILHIFAPKISYMQPIILICSALFIAMAFADLDALSLRYNINAYQNGEISMLDIPENYEASSSEMKFYPEIAKLDGKDCHKAKAYMLEYIKYNDKDDELRFDSDGEIIYKPKNDFRSYCKNDKERNEALYNYYNSMTSQEKADFKEDFKKLKEASYESYDDTYYDYSDDYMYKYNEKSGRYDIKEKSF